MECVLQPILGDPGKKERGNLVPHFAEEVVGRKVTRSLFLDRKVIGLVLCPPKWLVVSMVQVLGSR